MNQTQAREMEIEIRVEKETDRIDRAYMRGDFDETEYKARLDAVSRWADMAYSGKA